MKQISTSKKKKKKGCIDTLNIIYLFRNRIVQFFCNLQNEDQRGFLIIESLTGVHIDIVGDHVIDYLD